MKRFLLKCAVLLVFFLLLFAALFSRAVHYDTFNVFHWKDIRFTDAEPNKNFVKTQYIIHNPRKYNAFIFGSSRVGNLPPDMLPEELDGKPLNWYNMTYSMGIPAEHYLSLESFLAHGVQVDMVIVGFDNITMECSVDLHKTQLLRVPYQVYEENPWGFILPYLRLSTEELIKTQVDAYDREAHAADTAFFYGYGTSPQISDFSLTEHPVVERYEIGHQGYPFKDSYKDVEALVRLCAEHDIRLVLFTSPMYQTLYRNCVDDGYFDFLRKVAQGCEFYHFSTLNRYTQSMSYYYDCSHYRPVVGLSVEKVMFGTDEDRRAVREDCGDELFGVKVHAGNVDAVIVALQGQLAR